MIEIPPEVRMVLGRQQYRLVGGHSAVKLCRWTKKSLRNEGYCYKQKFYGIESHRCLQMSPAVSWCPNSCLYCWRAIEHTLGREIREEDADDPREIVEGTIRAQRELIVGYKGFPGTPREKFEEAWHPNQVAISLSGEPTAYPFIHELVREYNKRGMTTFLVTNGQYPHRLKRMKGSKTPFQTYLSVDAPDPDTYKRLDRPSYRDAWERLLESARIIKRMRTRRVARLTIVKGYNDKNPAGYLDVIREMNARWIEVKAYMWVGYSKKRLPREAMPLMEHVREFARRLEKESKGEYTIVDESTPSRVVLLEKKE